MLMLMLMLMVMVMVMVMAADLSSADGHLLLTRHRLATIWKLTMSRTAMMMTQDRAEVGMYWKRGVSRPNASSTRAATTHRVSVVITGDVLLSSPGQLQHTGYLL